MPDSAAAQELSLAHATIEELGRAFAEGTLTAERLLEMHLARIEAYDQRGPGLNAVLHVNSEALETARALDREREEQGPRSALHGIPVVLKDNFDTHDMPTTGGSLLLEGSIPPDDAHLVARLREAGAIILAKLNMSELASGVTMSSVGGYIRNPHDLERSPSGSSGGTGAAIAAWYAEVGFGTDTGGSVRGPSTSNGIVGLKPTHGLVSRDGIIPLSLTFDVPGPMARHVSDIAHTLNAIAGSDAADEATSDADERRADDYTASLDAEALDGARIGIARDFMGQDSEVDWIVESALHTMRDAGATIVEVRYPQWLLDVKGEWYTTIRWPDFRAQIPDYLATLDPEYPKSLAEMVERSREITSLTSDHGGPNPTRWTLLENEERSGTTDDPDYVTMREHGLPLVRGIVEGLFAGHELDAIVYPTSPTRPGLVSGGGGGGGPSPTNIANLTGFPDLIVPAGFTSDRLPVGISFFGTAFSEPRLLALGYAFEQLTRARRSPVHTPPLEGERIGG
ncbi:MAG: amidase family protein [Gemmatimonadota bacterium]|nr:amidase family protein [Gemmatimonadota bacterium]